MKIDMNISERDKTILLVFLIGAILVLSFKFGFMSLNDKAAVISEEVDKLDKEYARLYDMYKKEGQYKQKIKTYDETSNNVLKKFASNASQEYQIMFVNSLESRSNWIDVYTLQSASTQRALTNAKSGSYIGNTNVININFKAQYDDLMSFIQNVNNNQFKSRFSSISLSYNSKDSTISGTATLDTFAITGAGRKPEVVNAMAVLIGREESDSIFKSTTFQPNMTGGDESTRETIMENYDIFVQVNPWGSSLDSVIVGLNNSGKNTLSNNGNTKHKVTITFTGSNGNYKAAYKVDEKAMEAKDVFFGDSIELLISSSIRPDDVDIVNADIVIDNQTDRTVNYTIINDDNTHGRITVDKSGDVVAY